ncbi:MAG: penicillin-binding protein 1A, partial [Caulobacteraceae bacterium]
VRALVESAEGNSVRVRIAKGGSAYLDPKDVAWAKAGKGLNAGDLIFVEPGEKGGYALKQVPAVNGAFVVIEPFSGRTLALVGGYSFSLSNFNRATQAMRQPGSAFKPFVYATALENGYTPASTVMDAPIELRGASADDTWRPKNYNGKFYGSLTLRKGLELSRNTMTVRLAQAVGMRKIADMAIRAGVVGAMEPVLAMALGAGETTPFKLTGAYSIFANGGRRVEPHLIEEIQDREGKTMFRADRRECPGCRGAYDGQDPPLVDQPGTPIMNPVTAYQITSMLQGVVQRGTAVRASVLGRPIAGKTGTTNEYRSAWFVGYSPDMIAGVFIGFDDNRSLGEGEAGASAALPMFIDFMQQALKGKPIKDFKAPRDAKYIMVNGQREAFREGTEPRVAYTSGGGAGGGAAQPRNGPQPYNSLWKGGQVTGAPNAAAAVKPPPPKKPAQDLDGLY